MGNEIICGIYKIVSPSGRVYIGQSVNIYKRWGWYQRKYTKPSNYEQPQLYRSFRKYGVKAHLFEILCECDHSELDEKECYFIALYKSFHKDYGMNCTMGGGGCRGMKATEESRKKMSESHKGQKAWNTGKKGYLSEESLKKMREKKIGKIQSTQTKEKNKQSVIQSWIIRKESGNQNIFHSEATKKKMREIKLASLPSEKWTEKMREVWSKRKGFEHSALSKAKTRESVKLNWEQRRLTGKDSHSAETKKKMSESNKAAWEKRKSSKNWEHDKVRLGRRKNIEFSNV